MGSAPQTGEPPPAQATGSNGDSIFTREILALSAVVLLGTIMTVLDMTVVNVALATLGREFDTSISTIQWVATGYMLAFASVIPLTGWASERLGTKRLWILSICLFSVGSLLSGLAWSTGSLIAFRALQGLGGGMILPLGQTILARAAGPQRMGRVMSIIGVPMMLAPIAGPVIGGAIVESASWRWIFFVNLPVCLAALLLAVRLLPSTPPQPAERLDRLGLVLASGGIAIFAYGLAESGARGGLGDPLPLGAMLGGLALIAVFVLRSLRARNPLIDVRLFANRGFASASAANFVLGVALFGILILIPLYLQLVRGESPLTTGLLLIPQALGAACAMPLAGMLTDRLGARRVVPAGVVLALLGVLAYTQIGAETPFWYLSAALFLIGLGLGATIMPSMAAAYQSLRGEAIARASSALNTIQRVAGSIGTALLAVVLQRAIAGELPGFSGGLDEAAALAAQDRAHTADALAGAFATTFWVALGLVVVALVPALLLPGRPKDEGVGAPALGGAR